MSAHHHHHFSGDRFALSGVWGPPTSAANFCEEDYAITSYIAEFVNTLSNLSYVYFAIRHPRKQANGQTTKGLDSLSLALALVGVASAAFHGTLREKAQLCDDLSMLVLTTALLHHLFTVGLPRSTANFRTIMIISSTVLQSAVYLHTRDVRHHVLIFSGMVHNIWPRIMYLIYSSNRTREAKSELAWRLGRAAFALVFAFVVWNIDLEKCLELRALREQLGLPLGFLLEFHGWWHVFTAMGASGIIRLVRDVCDS